MLEFHFSMTSIMAVGFACATFGLPALSEVGFVESIVHTVFNRLSHTKQFRLKPVIRILIETACTYMYYRLLILFELHVCISLVFLLLL